MPVWNLRSKLNASENKLLNKLKSEWNKSFGYTGNFVELLFGRNIRDEYTLGKLFEVDEEYVFNFFKDLYDATGVAKKIIKAIKDKEKIFIYGDYDVDGITSTSLLWRFLYYELGADVIPFVPNREKEGYGLNKDAVLNMIEEGSWLITVDCGIRDGELIAELKKKVKDLKVIVTDHHQLPEDVDENDPLPIADGVVHPMHGRSKLEPKEICACEVVWGLICAMRSELKLSDSREGLELVALATVCDLMPLAGINRNIVKLGLKEFASTKIPGVKSLMNVAMVEPDKVSAYHLGFVLGPRINAAGRIGDPLDAVKMLSTNKHDAAFALAQKLDEINKDRQAATEYALEKVESELELESGEKIIVAFDETWEEGIVGLIAGKLHEKYHLPALAITKKKDGTLVGSARSSKDIDITNILSRHSHLLEKFGGHVQAAGFSLTTENLQKFREELSDHARKNIKAKDLEKKINYDLEISLKEFDNKLLDEIMMLEPFGNGNVTPIFLIKGIEISTPRIFGYKDAHLSAPIAEGTELVWFKHKHDPEKAHYYDLIVSLGYNEFRGVKKVQFIVKHHRAAIDK